MYQVTRFENGRSSALQVKELGVMPRFAAYHRGYCRSMPVGIVLTPGYNAPEFKRKLWKVHS